MAASGSWSCSYEAIWKWGCQTKKSSLHWKQVEAVEGLGVRSLESFR